ncbi:MAG: AAA family ATPase, partial [Planctomycetota bacterium]
WIDEAGLLDVRSINAIFEIAKEQDARVILSGDTRQHASPRRGEAMRLLEREAGLHVAKVEAIQRQKGQYRGAVELISKGHEIVDERTGKSGLLAGFDRLDEMGKIKEVGEEERLELLAEAYLGSIENKKSSLVVAPTHAEANAVTEKIRTSLKETGRLTGDERSFQQLRSLNLTDAEKREAMTYADQKGSVIQFHQNAKGGFKKGDRFRIAGAAGNQVRVSAMDGSGSRQLPLDVSNRFDIYQEQELKLCVGDKVRFSLGGKAMDGNKRISNGRMDEITGFDKTGNPVLERGTVIDKDYGHLGLGYVVTSHASQGKDRHVAIAAMSSQSLPAINAKQFYVTVSRGSEDVMLFVDDKSRIRRAIERSGEQMAATELVKARPDNRECDTTTDRGNEVFRQGQQLVRSFRDRVVNWWINRNEAHHQNEHVGRHREAQAGRDLSKDFTRSLGRGPELGGSF